MKKKLYGNYLGIVITGAEHDPEFRGRCQIFFPGVSNTLYKKINKNLKDLSFGHIDPNVFTPDIIKDLREVLPWAECAAPVVGTATSAYHNQNTGTTALTPDHTKNPDNPSAGYPPEQPLPNPADSSDPVDDIEGTKQNFQSIQGNGKTYDNTSISNIHPNILSIMAGIGATESGFREKEIADSWKYDPPSYFIGGIKGPNNYKTDARGFAKINSGYYQTSQDMGDKYGISNIHSGTFEEQTAKTAQFIQKEYPSLYSQAIRSNSPQELLSITRNMGRWMGPNDNPSTALNAIKTSNNDPYAYFSNLNSTKTPTYLSSNGKTSTEIPSIDPNVASSNPEPNNGANSPSIPYANYGPKPIGLFSCPAMGAKLWAFFYGGEIQRPVYFACVQDSWGIYNQNASEGPKNTSPLPASFSDMSTTPSQFTSTTGIVTNFAGMEFSGSSITNKGELPLNSSSAQFYNAAGAKLSMIDNNITLGTVDNAAGIGINDEGSSFYNQRRITLTASEIVLNGDVKTVSGVDQKNQKLSSDYLKKEQSAVNEIANQQASDISKGGEEINCPICEQKLADDKSDFVQRILRTIRKFSNILPWDCWNWGVTKFLINFIVTPMLSEISALAVSGGEGCGMCNKGKVKSYSQTIENSNKKSAETFAQKQNEINESAKNHKPGSNVQTVKGSYGIDAGGDQTNNAKVAQQLKDDCSVIPTGLKKGTGAKANPLHPSGEKVETVVFMPPNKTSAGDIFFKAANDIKMIAGSPGISMETNGKISITGGFLDLNSMDGPAVLTSKNVTNVNGAKVHITGAKGIGLTAPNVGVNGNLGVTGNLGVKGSVTIDGALSVKHLKIKTMRSETTSNSSPKSTSNATTYYTGGAAGINIFDKIKNLLVRDNPLKMLMLTPKGLLTIFQEVYDRVLLMIGIHPVPTGIFVSYTGTGVVYNFTSNSSKVPDDHSHQFDAPQMTRAADNAAWVNMADDPSSEAPNPAPSQGDDPVGGPHSLAGCGGGGFGFSTGSNASRRRTARNSRYGVPSNSLNYGRIIPEGYYNNTIITTTNTNLTGVSGDFITVTNDLSGNQITIYTDISGNQFTIGDGLTGTNITIDYDITPNSQIWKYDENGEISPRDLVRFTLSEECN